MYLVDVIKHKETGQKYIIGAGDPLPSAMYTRLRESISQDEAVKLVPQSKLVNRSQDKAKC